MISALRIDHNVPTAQVYPPKLIIGARPLLRAETPSLFQTYYGINSQEETEKKVDFIIVPRGRTSI